MYILLPEYKDDFENELKKHLMKYLGCIYTKELQEKITQEVKEVIKEFVNEEKIIENYDLHYIDINVEII